MRLTRSQFYVLLLALLTIAVGVVTNVATSQVPTWLQPYLWLSWPILGMLTVILIVLSLYQARQESTQQPEQAVEHTRKPIRSGVERLVTYAPKSDKKALRRYLKQLIETHKHFTFLGRAKPLDLEKIYIALKVGEYVPPALKPDATVRSEIEEVPERISGMVEVPEALQLNRRLVFLGEPGSGKTTALKYLALRIAKRDPLFGEFARKVVPNSLARWADHIQRRLSATRTISGCITGLCLVTNLVTWTWGLFHSPQPLLAGLIGLALAIGVFVIVADRPRVLVLVPVIGLLVYCAWVGLVPLLTIGAMALSLIALSYPYWIQPPLVFLKWLRNHSTRYPLPLYLTLNNLSHINEPLETYLARELHEVGFKDHQQFLYQRLDRGECLILLDALDEVVDEASYRWVVTEINRFAITHHRNPIVVTCRIAGFRGLLQGFLQLELQDFNESHIELFIRSWFADRSPAEQASQVDGLLRGLGRSTRLRLLAANPLLLSIIALRTCLALSHIWRFSRTWNTKSHMWRSVLRAYMATHGFFRTNAPDVAASEARR